MDCPLEGTLGVFFGSTQLIIKIELNRFPPLRK